MTAPIVTIVGERIALGPVGRALLPLYQWWSNDFGLLRLLGLLPAPVTAEQEGAAYEQHVAAGGNTDLVFTIYERGDGRAIGRAGLHDVDFRHGSATYSIFIGEADCRGRGYGTETTRLLLDYAFTALGLHSVLLTVYAFNAAGLRAYQKAGFKEIGRRRESYLMGGTRWDTVYMDCLASEFASPLLHAIFTPDAPRPAHPPSDR